MKLRSDFDIQLESDLLNICTFAEYKGNVVELTEEVKNEIFETVDELNASGMRVVAVAQKTNPSPEGLFSVQDESEMVLMVILVS